MRLILLGSPGAGKGTQAKLIAQKYHIPHISTGDILRDAVRSGSKLGLSLKKRIEEGKLVPDDIVIQLVLERIKQPDCQKGFLLDGFPRTIVQAESLHRATPVDCIIDILVPEDEIIKRLTGRRIHLASGRIYHILYNPPRVPNRDDITGEELIQRADDKEEAVRKRLAVYKTETTPLQEYYQNYKKHHQGPSPLYITIDGTSSIDEIKKQIFSLLDNLKE